MFKLSRMVRGNAEKYAEISMYSSNAERYVEISLYLATLYMEKVNVNFHVPSRTTNVKGAWKPTWKFRCSFLHYSVKVRGNFLVLI